TGYQLIPFRQLSSYFIHAQSAEHGLGNFYCSAFQFTVFLICIRSLVGEANFNVALIAQSLQRFAYLFSAIAVAAAFAAAFVSTFASVAASGASSAFGASGAFAGIIRGAAAASRQNE